MSLISLAPLLATLAPAQAGDFIVAVGPEVELMSAGTWARALWVDDGWKIFHSSNGDYYVADLVKTGDGLADWEMDRANRKQLTSHGELKDHAIKRCPDGTFLHIASANLDRANDSSYAWVYDENFDIVASAPLEERTDRDHNDASHYCSRLGRGVAYGGGPGGGTIFRIEDDLSITAAGDTPNAVGLQGSSFWVDPDAGEISLVTSSEPGNLNRHIYDADLNLMETLTTPYAQPGTRAYWPMGLLKVGDFWIVAHIFRPEPTQEGGDDGNVRVIVLDESWSIVEEAILTDNEIRDSGQRTWLARKGSQVLFSYDRQRQHTVIEMTIDLSRFGVDAESDTGWDGSSGWGGEDGGSGGGAGGDDTGPGDEDDEDGKGGCDGCAAVGPGAAVGGLILALAAAATRRRREDEAVSRS